MANTHIFGYGNFDLISGGHVTEKQVQDMIDSNNKTYVNSKITADIKANNEDFVSKEIDRVSFVADDVKVYSTIRMFPGCLNTYTEDTETGNIVPGTKPNEDMNTDAIYQAADTGIQYIWVADNSLIGGYYKMVSEAKAVSEEDIRNIITG